jgi:hypothetical protein
VTTKEQLARLVDELSPEELATIEAFAAFLVSRRQAATSGTQAEMEQPSDPLPDLPPAPSSEDVRELFNRPPHPDSPSGALAHFWSSVDELRAKLGAMRIVLTDPDHWQAEYADGRREHVDPMLQALYSAPADDEPLTDEERAAIEEARAEIERGETEPWEKVRTDLLGPG